MTRKKMAALGSLLLKSDKHNPSNWLLLFHWVLDKRVTQQSYRYNRGKEGKEQIMVPRAYASSWEGGTKTSRSSSAWAQVLSRKQQLSELRNTSSLLLLISQT